MSRYTFSLQTRARTEFVNIDHLLKNAVQKSGVQEGICVVFNPHTTAAITINENADPDVVRDLREVLDRIIPSDIHFKHFEGNSDAHFKSSLFGPSLSLVVEGGRIVLGTWQSVYFCEVDGPRQRSVTIKVIKG